MRPKIYIHVYGLEKFRVEDGRQDMDIMFLMFTWVSLIQRKYRIYGKPMKIKLIHVNLWKFFMYFLPMVNLEDT